jgi:hypothetical protein
VAIGGIWLQEKEQKMQCRRIYWGLGCIDASWGVRADELLLTAALGEYSQIEVLWRWGYGRWNGTDAQFSRKQMGVEAAQTHTHFDQHAVSAQRAPADPAIVHLMNDFPQSMAVIAVGSAAAGCFWS